MDTQNPNEVKNNNNLAIVIVIIIAVIIGWFVFNLKKNVLQTAPPQNSAANVETNIATTAATTAPLKEFAMTSFYDDKGIWFSLKEISVNRGEIVRIKVTNIKGAHDFVIDEYNIKKITPLNEEVVIEFTADKAGEFIYYCSVSGHRQKGQWGTLKVLDN
ncbi:MAG: cupredoxin domain-containing protein [bacterium]|nr:cupredoxin domain-containing protein [bacterium]